MDNEILNDTAPVTEAATNHATPETNVSFHPKKYMG